MAERQSSEQSPEVIEVVVIESTASSTGPRRSARLREKPQRNYATLTRSNRQTPNQTPNQARHRSTPQNDSSGRGRSIYDSSSSSSASNESNSINIINQSRSTSRTSSVELIDQSSSPLFLIDLASDDSTTQTSSSDDSDFSVHGQYLTPTSRVSTPSSEDLNLPPAQQLPIGPPEPTPSADAHATNNESTAAALGLSLEEYEQALRAEQQFNERSQQIERDNFIAQQLNENPNAAAILQPHTDSIDPSSSNLSSSNDSPAIARTSAEVEPCVICFEDCPQNTFSCRFCSKSVGCLSCVQSWFDNAPKNHQERTCPLCRHKWTKSMFRKRVRSSSITHSDVSHAPTTSSSSNRRGPHPRIVGNNPRRQTANMSIRGPYPRIARMSTGGARYRLARMSARNLNDDPSSN